MDFHQQKDSVRKLVTKKIGKRHRVCIRNHLFNQLSVPNISDTSDKLKPNLDSKMITNNCGNEMKSQVNTFGTSDILSTSLTDDYSFQGRTQNHQTRKAENILHVWIDKIRFHCNKKFNHKLDYDLVSKQDFNKTETYQNSDKYGEILDEEATSCYNQFKTRSFDIYFQTFNNDSLILHSLDSNSIESLFFSPLDEFKYQDLTTFKEQIHDLLSSESLADFDDSLKASQEIIRLDDKETGLKILDTNTLLDKPVLEEEFPTSNVLTQLLGNCDNSKRRLKEPSILLSDSKVPIESLPHKSTGSVQPPKSVFGKVRSVFKQSSGIQCEYSLITVIKRRLTLGE